MHSPANHTLFEFSPVLGDYVFHAESLQLDCRVEVFADDFVSQEIPHSLVEVSVFSADFNYFIDEDSLVANDFLDALVLLFLRDILENYQIFKQSFLFQELCAVLSTLRSVDNEELEGLAQSYFDRDVIFIVDRLNEFVQLT